jgi:hypothetical protein
LASLTVLVVLTVRSSAEVITLTEETFSDKVRVLLAVPFSLDSLLSALPSSRGYLAQMYLFYVALMDPRISDTRY